MSRGRTLWEMLVDRLRGPIELQFYNPLRAKIGSPVLFNDVELKEHNFFVKEIRAYRRTIGAGDYYTVDYVLLARELNKADLVYRLRLNPVQDPNAAGGLSHHALLLRLYDEFAYTEDFHKVVNDRTRKFQVMENGQVTEEYHRIHDVTDSYHAEVWLIRDVDGDGRVDPNEVEKSGLEYWDYWREATDEAGQPRHEYLFVEMDGKNGWFQIWRGPEIDAQQVLMI